MVRRFVLVAVSAILLPQVSACFGLVEKDHSAGSGIALVDVTVLTMKNDRVLSDQTVIIRHGRISEIGAVDQVVVPAGLRQVSGGDRFLVPGLVDAHIHLRHAEPADLVEYLRAGITCAREMNGRPFLLEWRDRIEAGDLTGPCLSVAAPTMGNFSSPKEGYPTPASKVAAVEAVEQFHAQGYDWIKIYTFLNKDGFSGVMRKADELGIPVGGHTPIDVGLLDVISAEVTSIEHLTEYVGSSLTEEALDLDQLDFRSTFGAGDVDWQEMDTLIAATVAKDIWNVPTLVWFDRNLPVPMAAASWADEELREQGASNRREIVRRLHIAGARIAVGTDSDAGDDLDASAIHDELHALSEAGISAEDILKMATSNGARLLGMDDEVGTVSVDLRADLLLLPCDPRLDLSCLRHPDIVLARGNLVVD